MSSDSVRSPEEFRGNRKGPLKREGINLTYGCRLCNISEGHTAHPAGISAPDAADGDGESDLIATVRYRPEHPLPPLTVTQDEL